MIVSGSEKYVVSSMGWIDKGAIWRVDTETDQLDQFQISEAEYLSLHKGDGDYFAAVHHFTKTELKITAHDTSNPEKIVASVSFEEGEPIFEGDLSIWKSLPKAYIDYCPYKGVYEYWLCLINSQDKSVDFQKFEWYDDTYDKGYQGITGVAEVPGADLLLISVQRSSDLVLYDPIGQKMVRKIFLAGSYGNPEMYFRSKKESELWVNDYDTLLKLNPGDWSVIAVNKLQTADKGSSAFIGEFAFDNSESICVVARPFSRDVVSVNTRNLKIKHSCQMDAQPLLVSVLGDGRVFARSWKKGKLLKGQLKRDSWFSWF